MLSLTMWFPPHRYPVSCRYAARWRRSCRSFCTLQEARAAGVMRGIRNSTESEGVGDLRPEADTAFENKAVLFDDDLRSFAREPLAESGSARLASDVSGSARIAVVEIPM
jgi:hypothetical protein